jgi:hypothetical protein
MLGEAWQDLDLVLDQGDGGPFSPDALSRAIFKGVIRGPVGSGDSDSHLSALRSVAKRVAIPGCFNGP